LSDSAATIYLNTVRNWCWSLLSESGKPAHLLEKHFWRLYRSTICQERSSS